MTGAEIKAAVKAIGKTEAHIRGFKMANGMRLLFNNEQFSCAKHVNDSANIMILKKKDTEGKPFYILTSLDEIIQIIVADNADDYLYTRSFSD